jgi:hypothetical protein
VEVYSTALQGGPDADDARRPAHNQMSDIPPASSMSSFMLYAIVGAVIAWLVYVIAMF